MLKKHRHHAFTLVELLVVIGIIALLISILLPALGRVQRQAKAIKCQSNIRQIVGSLLMYREENKGWFPSCSGRGSWINAPQPTADQAQSDWIHWQTKGNPASPRDVTKSAINKYLKLSKDKLDDLMRCPSDTEWANHPDVGAGVYPYSYTLSDKIGRESWNTSPNKETSGRKFSSKVINNPSDKILIAEEQLPNDAKWSGTLVTSSVAEPDFLTTRHATDGRTATTGKVDINTWGAVVGAYCGMCDGSVQKFSTNEAFTARHIDPSFK